MKYEEICEIAMEIIANSGEAKSLCFEAIEEAKLGNFNKAEILILEAEKLFIKAHDIQNDLISKESKGEGDIKINLILVHSQDHLSMATVVKDSARYFIDIFKELKKEVMK